MKRNRGWLILLGSVILVGLLLRLYRLDQNIPSLYIDETSGHYWIKQRLLSPIKGVADLIYPKLFWAPYTLTWLLGNSPLGVRSLAALFGSLIPVTMYLVASVLQTKKNSCVPLISAAISSILPWGFMISRIGYTNIPLIINLILLHVYFFIRAKRAREYLLSLLFLFLALLYYQSMVVIVPVVSLFVFAYTLKNTTKKTRIIILSFLGILLLMALPFVIVRYELLSLSGRGLDLAIWRDVNTPYDTDRYRALSWNSEPSLFSFNLPPEQLANKLFLNRVTANLSIFTKNYLSFFSPDWLFLKGDAILRHSTGMVGAFYPFLLPFMLFGAFKFFSTADKKARRAVLVWILVSPIPAAITKDGAGYLLRAVTLLPFLTYFCALGVVESFSLIKKRLRWPYGIALGLIGVYSAWSFFYGYFHVYPALSTRAYESGFRELSDFQISHQNASLLIIWDGYYHNGDFRFWQETPYDQYQNYKMKRLEYGSSIFWQTWPNLFFSAPKSATDFEAFTKALTPDYVVLPDRYFVKYPLEIQELLTPVKEIKYPDQTTALTIYISK